MAAAEEQQQRSQAASPNGENAAHVANQVSSKSEQKLLGNVVEKADTEGNEQIAGKEMVTELGTDAEDEEKKKLRDEGSMVSIGADSESGDGEEDTEVKKVDPVVEEDSPVPKEVEAAGDEEKEQVEVVKEVEKAAEELPSTENGDGTATDNEGAMEVDSGWVEKDSEVEKNEETGGATSLPMEQVRSAVVADAETGNGGTLEKTPVAMEVDSGEKETPTDSTKDEDGIEVTSSTIIVMGSTNAASQDGAIGAISEVNLDAHVTTGANERNGEEFRDSGNEGAPLGGAEVNEVVGQIVHTLVDSVVECMNETLSIDADSVKMLSSPMMPHLSADEAMELLEAHQGDDHEFKLDHDDDDADVEAAIGKPEYQWFDGDDDDEEGVAIVSPSALDDVTDTTDDVFGFGGVVDLTGVAHTTGENAGIESDGSGDTVVIQSCSSSPKATRSSSSSSSSSSGSASSASSSSSSASSVSEDESVGRGSKKRTAPRSSGPRKLLKYKKQKRVRSSEPEGSSQRRYKRKRKIPEPVIPKEFEVFDSATSDPILKGSYSVRNNRRACFVGNWGFSDEAFYNGGVSPFEYTSRARVLQSRRKDDKRPISGKYGGFFKLRLFNGKLVKIREDQVDLQFLPMPPEDEEDGDEDMEGYASDEDDGDEPAATRYTVLGKGKNRYGRFLIRGYLAPETGRLVVKRHYLE